MGIIQSGCYSLVNRILPLEIGISTLKKLGGTSDKKDCHQTTQHPLQPFLFFPGSKLTMSSKFSLQITSDLVICFSSLNSRATHDAFYNFYFCISNQHPKSLESRYNCKYRATGGFCLDQSGGRILEKRDVYITAY